MSTTQLEAPIRTAQRLRVHPALIPFLVMLGLALLLPLAANDYWALIATRAAIYWILVAGLNLIVGFAGQLAIGYVALFALGAYTASILAAGNVMPAVPVFAALAAAGVVGAVAGVVVGLPALRLRTFYFAMTTLGFATIVTQVALGWQSVTGGGIGLAGPSLPAPFDGAWGFYYLCLGLAALCTWMTANVARSRFGRALIAIREAEVAAEASGISKPMLLVAVFLFAGAVAGVAGGLFASLQTYITPDAFTFDLSLLFFIAVLIGGRGSILGPLLGTIILTLLPEIAAPLAAWSTCVYAVLLLVIVLVLPGGIAGLLDFRGRRALPRHRVVQPQLGALAALLEGGRSRVTMALRGVVLAFGGVRAIDGLDMDVEPGAVHGLIGPNGSGKTTTLNVISGYYRPQTGGITLDGAAVAGVPSDRRRSCGHGRAGRAWRNRRRRAPPAGNARPSRSSAPGRRGRGRFHRGVRRSLRGTRQRIDRGGRHGAAAAPAPDRDRGQVVAGGERLFRLGRADEADGDPDDQGRAWGAGVDHLEQAEQGRRCVADDHDRAVEPVAPEFHGSGGPRGAEPRRQSRDVAMVQGADDRIGAGQAAAGDPVGDHGGIAEDRRARGQGRDPGRRRPCRKMQGLGDLDHAAGMDDAHGHPLFRRVEARQGRLGADDRERAAIDFRPVADIVRPGVDHGPGSVARRAKGGIRATTPFFKASGRSFQGISPSGDSA